MSFIAFEPDDFIVSSEEVIAPLWSGNNLTLNSGSLYTSSLQESSTDGKFYLNVYNMSSSAASGSCIQFAIAYGNISGSGSAPFNNLVPQNTPSRAVYGQYRNIIYGDENAEFNFNGLNGNSPDILVINVARSRYKESLNTGCLNLQLITGSITISLTDDSNASSVVNYIGGNRVYNIVSGSAGLPYNSSSVQTPSGSYGLFFPDIATIILNPQVLSLPYASGGLGLTLNTTSSLGYSSVVNDNNRALFNAIRKGNGFSLQSSETISATYFDVHVKLGELNYTTNPSIVDSNGNLLYPTLVNNPQVFPTTVGLYSNANELLAVAKLSSPLPKDFTKTLTLRTKISF